MPPAAPQAGGGQEEGSTAIIWAVVGIFVILWLIWYAFQVQIVAGYLALKLWEIKFIGFFTSSTRVADLRSLLETANPAALDFKAMVAIGQLVGGYFRILFTGILVALAFFIYFGNSTRLFKNIYSMKTLSNHEKNNWPQIMPVSKLNLIQIDIDTGPWAMAMTPMQFCKKYDLIELYRQQRQDVPRKEANRIEVVLKRGEANKVFALQLGPRWEGINRLPPYARALFAAFAARINADTKPAAALLQQLNRTSLHKMDYKGVDALCKKYESTKLVKEITNSHAYVLTVMASMLTGARLDGVQATADFLWLKPLDRRLWYMLNTMGRQTPFTEAAGPYSHWLAEKEAGRKLVVPMVEAATNAMDIALKGIKYNPEEDK
jgi:intracellular multiplication protein IcmP